MSEYVVELSEELGNRLVALRGASTNRRRAALERAIHSALDAEGWPAGERGEVPIPASYWYVVVQDPNPLRMRGHVGPIYDEELAKRVARSWRQTGCVARHGRSAIGPPLTNALDG